LPMPDYQQLSALFTVTESDGRFEIRPASVWSQCGYVLRVEMVDAA
jgi:hypothetical protein